MISERVVIVNIKCGLGNQLFQYATGRALAIKKNAELKVYRQNDMLPGRMYQLNKFKADIFEASEDDVKKIISPSNIINKKINYVIYLIKKNSLARFIARIIKRKLIKSLPDSIGFVNQESFFREDDVSEWSTKYRKEINDINPPCFIQGYFPSYKYFHEIRSVLLEEFNELSVPISDKGKEVLSLIENSKSVSINFRRGDAVSISEVELWYKNIVTEEYYNNAIDYIKSRVRDPYFFVFSNDIKWVKDNFNFRDSLVYFVDHNNSDSGYEDLYLMSKCKHNITTGYSSFSWWGAYLNNNPNKIVLRTKQACGIDRYNFPDDLYPPEWTIIESEMI